MLKVRKLKVEREGPFDFWLWESVKGLKNFWKYSKIKEEANMKRKIVTILMVLVVTIALNMNSFDYANDNRESNRIISSEIILEKIFKVEFEKKEIFLGRNFYAKVNQDDELYILDKKSRKIHVFSHDGSYKTTIGGKGEGPGEFRNSSALMFYCNEIWVFEHFSPIIHVFNKKTKKFIKRKKLSYLKGKAFYNVDYLSKKNKVLYSLINLDPKFNSFISFYLSDLTFKESSLFYNTLKYKLLNTEMLGISYCYDQEGHIFIAPRSKKEFIIKIYSFDGKFVKEIKKQDYIPIKKSFNKLKRLKEKAELRKKKGLSKKPLHNYKTSIQQIVCDYKQRIWVLTPSKKSEDNFLNIAIFNIDGKLLSTINLSNFQEPELIMNDKFLYIIEKNDRANKSRFFIKYKIIELK